MASVKIMSVENTEMIDIVDGIPTFGEAVRAAIRMWGGNEKTVYTQLKIDQGYWSKILSGKGGFPMEKLKLFCEIVQNDLVLHWIVLPMGYELRVIPKTLEDKLTEAEKKILERDKKIEHYESLLFDMTDKAKLLKFNK